MDYAGKVFFVDEEKKVGINSESERDRVMKIVRRHEKMADQVANESGRAGGNEAME